MIHTIVKQACGFVLFTTLVFSFSKVWSQAVTQPLPAWQEGQLDIHHINTGRGNAMEPPC
jgi:hypothetical protein